MAKTGTNTRQAVGGTNGGTNNAAPAPGSVFGYPKYGTQWRLIPDAGNESTSVTPVQGSQVNLPTTRFDQLDIVRGWKLEVTYVGNWTHGSGKTLTVSPFFPANVVAQITVKLQAAYNTFNQTGPLAAIIQAFRPMWGAKGVGTTTPDRFATIGTTLPTSGVDTTETMVIDVPASIKLDEYYDLDAQGNPTRKLYDAIISPTYMAAQARTVVPTVTFNQGLAINDLLNAPVSGVTGDTTSTFTDGAVDAGFTRDAFWTANNPASNPPQFAWLYTRDYIQQPTNGQAKVSVLLQNTGISLGQILSIYGFVWDPALNGGQGGTTPLANIATFEVVTGGSLQNWLTDPALMTDRCRSLYGHTVSAELATANAFVFDWAMDEEGGYLTNSYAINTYLVNGVALNITFNNGSAPSSTSTVYLGVEALKLATS